MSVCICSVAILTTGQKPDSGYKKIMLNSAQLEFFPAHKCLISTTVVILTFMSRKNNILSLLEPEKCLVS